MKKGKKQFLKIHPSFSVKYGTVDCIEFKSLYLNISSWVEPNEYIQNPRSHINTISREVKHHLLDINNTSIFKDKFIVDMDLRYSGIELNKRSFMSIDSHFYLNESNMFDFKSSEIIRLMEIYSSSIIDNVLTKKSCFDFYTTKSNKNNLTLEYIT